MGQDNRAQKANIFLKNKFVWDASKYIIYKFVQGCVCTSITVSK